MTTTEEARTPGQEPTGAWMQTYCLPHFRVLDPEPSQILIEDIAHHLSQNVRYGGAGIRFYSVAEHSVHMARAASPEDALWALLHDASEAYLHDVVRPVKRALSGYSAAEDRIMRAICERFGLPMEMPAEVKRLDNRILIDETRQNMRPSDVVWSFGGETEPLGVTLQYWTPEQAEREFLATFAAITGQPVTMPATPAPSSPGVPDSVRALSEAANDVLAERRRQVEVEGWTPKHDDGHRKGELGYAAACYAAELDLWTGCEQADRKGRPTLIGAHRVWPWLRECWKLTDRRRNLVKAGALILAEIERLDRLPAPPASSGQESA